MSWACTVWIPFALVARAVAADGEGDVRALGLGRRGESVEPLYSLLPSRPASSSSSASSSSLSSLLDETSSAPAGPVPGEREDAARRCAGAVMALHNAAISAPQVLAAGVCAGVMYLSRAGTREVEAVDADQFRGVLAFGGMAGFVAAGVCWWKLVRGQGKGMGVRWV